MNIILFVPEFDWRNTDPEVIMMSTTGVLRMRRRGETFFLEGLSIEREWYVFAISKDEVRTHPPQERTQRSYLDALKLLEEKNRETIESLIKSGGAGGGVSAAVVGGSPPREPS